MKQILKSLEKQKDKLEVKIQHRDDYLSNRSDNWQESQKGEDYADETYRLEEVLNELEEVIESLEHWISDN